MFPHATVLISTPLVSIPQGYWCELTSLMRKRYQPENKCSRVKTGNQSESLVGVRLSETLLCPWVDLSLPYIRNSTDLGSLQILHFGKFRTCCQKRTEVPLHVHTHRAINKQTNNNTPRSQQLYLNRSYFPNESKTHHFPG